MGGVTGDGYLGSLVRFVDKKAEQLIEGSVVLKLNPVGLHYVHSRLESLQELEGFLSGAPVDYLRAYISDLGDHRALEHLRRILRLLSSLKIVSSLPPPVRDPTPISLSPFSSLRVLELRGCDLSTSPFPRGLLELRHTLEKIICHNSTNALRHVLASRIIDVKDSPQWKRLSFISCACNNLVLMDDSLQLLPVVEVLDISRNKFTKVDNLWRCSKLKHLDLGFNNIRTLTSFRKVPSHIVKLILRNNALTTLHGIESLKSLEGLDLSFNIISSFLELGVLVGLSSLQCLWLEGNPLCSAPWYRAHVSTFFAYPHKVIIDGKGISLKEFCKRRIILAGQKKKPSSYGLYSPAQVNTEEDVVTQTNLKKVSRIAYIESGDQNSDVCSEKEPNTELLGRTTSTISDEDVKISNLMDRIELLKKEESVLWLHKFNEWMEQKSEKQRKNNNKFGSLNADKDNCIKSMIIESGLGETSKHHVVGSLSRVESSLNSLQSENSVDHALDSHTDQCFDQISEADTRFLCREGVAKSPSSIETTFDHKPSLQEDEIDIVRGSFLLHDSSKSPPRYQEDILHLRRSFIDESLQRSSSSSFSSGSSDSTSFKSDACEHDDDSCRISNLSPPVNACSGNPERRFPDHALDTVKPNECEELLDRIELDPLICDRGSVATAVGHPSNKKTVDNNTKPFKRKPKRRVVQLSENSFSSEAVGLMEPSGIEEAEKFQIRDFTVPSSNKKMENTIFSGCDLIRIVPLQDRGMVVGTSDFIV